MNFTQKVLFFEVEQNSKAMKNKQTSVTSYSE